MSTDQLEKSDITVKAGRFEVFPSGRKILRAPLGRDCVLLDNDDLVPVGDQRASVEHVDWLLKHDKVERLEIPSGYRATLVRSAEGSARRQRGRFNQASTISPYMQRVDKLINDGLTDQGQRNTALLDLCWYYHVVLRHDSETVNLDLRSWIDQNHNDVSDNYNRAPRAVYAHIERIVANFDWEQVSLCRRMGKGPGYDRALEFLRDLPLRDRARCLLAHFIAYAVKRGERQQWGYVVEVPSRTLKTWDRTYGPFLRVLIKKGHIRLGRNYARARRCQSYHIMTVPDFEDSD